MRKSIGLRLFVTFVVVLGLWGCSKKSKSERAAQALEDRLTDALNFEGGKMEEGTPPAGTDSATAPQIQSVEAPEEFRLGADFAVQLSSNYNQNETVTRAIIHVLGSGKYIVISPIHLVEGRVVLAGALSNDLELRLKEFTIEYALQTTSGVTGYYTQTGLKISEDPAQTVGQPINALSVSNENTYFESGRPVGSEKADVPQIETIDAPAKLKVGDAFTVKLYSNFAQTETVVAAILTTPHNEAYYEIEGTLTSMPTGMAMIVEGHLATEGLEVGDLLTFLYALKTSQGQVGAYRSWSVEVVEDILVDGDADIDTEPELEPEIEPEPEPEAPPVHLPKMQPARTVPMSLGRSGEQVQILTITPFSDGLKTP